MPFLLSKSTDFSHGRSDAGHHLSETMCCVRGVGIGSDTNFICDQFDKISISVVRQASPGFLSGKRQNPDSWVSSAINLPKLSVLCRVELTVPQSDQICHRVSIYWDVKLSIFPAIILSIT
jgi:hypothetical protein